MKNNMQGSYLKEIAISFILNNKNLKPADVTIFLNNLIQKIGLTPVECHLNELPPGFDMVYTMRESCVYFGFWAEVNFVRMHLISCKDFTIDMINNIIVEYFNVGSKIKIDIIKDSSIWDEIKKL